MRALAIASATAIPLLGLATPAGAATVTGKLHEDEDGTDFGTMHFRAGPGVANRVTVKPDESNDSFFITERAERLRASGACDQVNGHTARCPITESDDAVEIILGGGADRVGVKRACAGRYYCSVNVVARGGAGGDVLTGGGKFYAGNAVLADVFYDDETDAQAARALAEGPQRPAVRLPLPHGAVAVRESSAPSRTRT
jgi:hypothetical protein